MAHWSHKQPSKPGNYWCYLVEEKEYLVCHIRKTGNLVDLELPGYGPRDWNDLPGQILFWTKPLKREVPDFDPFEFDFIAGKHMNKRRDPPGCGCVDCLTGRSIPGSV